MALESNRLSVVKVNQLLREQLPGMYPDGAGLYLRIRNGGGACWTFRWKRHGQERNMSLGNPKDTPLANARRAASVARMQLDAGIDPLDSRRADQEKNRNRGTFRELAEDWYQAECTNRIKHPQAIRRGLDKYLLPKLGNLKASDVRPDDCSRILEAARTTAPTTCNDLLRYMKSIFAFGIRKHRGITTSPVATFTNKLDAGGQEKPRQRYLSRSEIVQLFDAIRNEPSFGGDNLLIVRLLLALAVRKSELFAAQWSQFDLDGDSEDGPMWKLPTSKKGFPQNIPLSPLVVNWLKSAKQYAGDSIWAFPARRQDSRSRYKHIGVDTLNAALKRIKHSIEPFTVHDFRRTARTHLAELGVAPHIAELCLNHKPRGIEQTYNKHTYFFERRVALESWSNLLAQMEAGQTKIVPIRHNLPINKFYDAQ